MMAISEKQRIAKAKWERRHAKRRREAKLLQKYGISAAQMQRLYSEQGGKCHICDLPIRNPLEDVESSTHAARVDHCHETKMVRGLLCDPCNKGLGMFRDSVELLSKAIAYIFNGFVCEHIDVRHRQCNAGGASKTLDTSSSH